MTEMNNTLHGIQEAGLTPASCISETDIIPREEGVMSKLGYFVAGVAAGATALAATAYLVDKAANKQDVVFDDDEEQRPSVSENTNADGSDTGSSVAQSAQDKESPDTTGPELNAPA